MSNLPPHVIRQVQQVLDRAARRILAERLEAQARGTTSGASDSGGEPKAPDEGGK